MKMIKEELINKLKQLDRIELRQRLKETESDGTILIPFIWDMFFIFGFIFLAIPIYYTAFGIEAISPFLRFLEIMSKILPPIFVLLMFIDIGCILLSYIKRRKIMNEYFKVEAKK